MGHAHRAVAPVRVKSVELGWSPYDILQHRIWEIAVSYERRHVAKCRADEGACLQCRCRLCRAFLRCIRRRRQVPPFFLRFGTSCFTVACIVGNVLVSMTSFCFFSFVSTCPLRKWVCQAFLGDAASWECCCLEVIPTFLQMSPLGVRTRMLRTLRTLRQITPKIWFGGSSEPIPQENSLMHSCLFLR